MREVVSLQFGDFSNFIGTHLWNSQLAQFDYDTSETTAEPPTLLHDTLFRQGRSPRGEETYTPRLLLFDLKENFGSLKRFSTLFEADEEASVSNIWGGAVNQHQQERHQKNEYLTDLDAYTNATSAGEVDRLTSKKYNLAETVQYWSDYSSAYYHPKSLYQISPSGNDGSRQMVSHASGCDAFEDFEKKEGSLENGLRFFVEECDSLQGFHTTVDVHDGFTGFAERFLQNLRDEFPKTSVITYGVSHPPAEWISDENLMDWRRINSATAMAKLSELSSLYIPLDFPSFRPNTNSSLPCGLNSQLRYNTSAVLALGIESASLPYRCRKINANMDDVVSQVTLGNRIPLGSLAISFPFRKPLVPRSVDRQSRETVVTPITPKLSNYTFGGNSAAKDGKIYGLLAVLRGSRLMLNSSEGIRRHEWTNANSGTELVEEYLESTEALRNSSNFGFAIDDGFPLSQTFPDIQSECETASSSVSALTFLETNSEMETYIVDVLRDLEGGEAVGGGMRYWSGYGGKVSTDTYREIIDGLKDLRERCSGGGEEYGS